MKKMQVVICSAILLFNLVLNLTSCTRELKKNDQSPNSDQQKTENENKDKNKDKDKQETPVVVKNMDVTVPDLKLLLGDKPHDYKIKISWPVKKFPVSVQSNGVILNKNMPQDPNFFEFDALENTKYEIELLEEVEDSMSILKIWNFSTSEDVVISSNEILDKDLDIKAFRIFITKTALIETKNYNLNLSANEDLIVEEGAEIVNFQNKNQSDYKNSGLNGGNVSIISKNAEGKLKVNLNGTNGFKGLTLPPLSAPQATSGKNGENGIIDFADYDKDNKSCIFSIPLGREKAVPGDTCTLKCICKKQPTNGENSHSGIKGIQGLPGSPGGDSGKLVVVIENKSSFLLEHSETPGVGGLGGEGSPGQLKGLIGKAGIIEKNEFCPASTCQQAVDGADTGLDGAPGSPGPQGENGVANPVCVKIGKGTNACSNL
jgi:hypothetical protein